MASYLDHIRAYAIAVLRSKHAEDAARLVAFFHDRFSGFESEGHWVPDSDECTGGEMSDHGFTLSFGTRHIHYSSYRNRWLATDVKDDEPQVTDAHHVAVSQLGTPFAFLEGLRFGVECVAAAGVAAVENRKASLTEAKINRAIERYVHYTTETREMRRRAKAPRFKKMAKELCATNFPCDGEMPNPPQQTTTLEIARAAFADTSGVYFLWNEDEIEYVGRADRIGKRLSPAHHKLRPHHRVSIVEMSAGESWVAECYYIWRFRPVLNGQVAKVSEALTT